MYKRYDREGARRRRHRRVRRKVDGTTARPRLMIHKSLRHVSAQVIDDARGHTIASASTLEPEVRKQVPSTAGVAAAMLIGRLVAERARAKGISAIVFDRSGYPYHGGVAALAEEARKAGMRF